jgi:O-acetyl-ADP-ribose deacetylase (regulator of RNase III)
VGGDGEVALQSDAVTINNQVKLMLRQGDITAFAVGAIVNAANSGLMGGGGVDGAIHRAGGPSILAECRRIIAEIGRLPAGEAVVTGAGNLPAGYVIHTVGPVWRGGSRNEAKLLASAYRESLKRAEEKGITSIAFPSISTGAYGYPLAAAAEVALQVVIAFIEERVVSIREVTFVLFSEPAMQAYRQALGSIMRGRREDAGKA